MIKTILTIALVLTVGIAQADDKKERPDKKPEKGEKGKGKGKGDFFAKLSGDDDVITAEEWANSPMAKRAKEAGKGDAIAARFKKMDGDGDGKVTKEEFAKAMQRGKGKGDKGKGKPGGDGKKPEGKKPEGKKPKADS